MKLIPFNQPYFTGKETEYITDALLKGQIAANGKYTQMCQRFFETKYGFKKVFLTNSCTQALEMATLLMQVGPGDEIIMPSYTFVSTANAFALRGCKIVFADSRPDFPGMDETQIGKLITKRTKAIVVVHYGGIACDMKSILELVHEHGLLLVEDAAPAVNAGYNNKSGNEIPLGTLGHFAVFSFHETKNISSGEGGMLVVNDDRFMEKAQVIWDKGTNRSAFQKGLADHYQWISLGSAYGPSEIMAACLWAQLQELAVIQKKRKGVWDWYENNLPGLLSGFDMEWMDVPPFARHNYHMFYGVAKNKMERDRLIAYLKKRGVMAVFHYQCLHLSTFYRMKNPKTPRLREAEKYGSRLVRFPFFYQLDLKTLVNHLK